ncbi:MAG: serine/threonine protein kinase [Deltaproteobacteria bacterium]|nr:MAG: serine/threonine protein kinase [Deltaproteobacteria bacterium]
MSDLGEATQPEGQRIGPYLLLSRLAEGGMAEVWLARHEGPGGLARQVVVKCIKGARADDPRFRRMFVNEAELAMRLTHGNIAQVFDFGEVGGQYYLAMEYVRGVTLAQLRKRAAAAGLRIPCPLCAAAIREAARGLHHAHRARDERGRLLGIVHRDVSPENIMVSFDGQVKVVDFGIARAETSVRLTAPGAIKGKYLYFAPEQARFEAVDARTDVFACGVVLYQLLSGRLPVRGRVLVALDDISKGRWTPLSELDPSIPEGLARIVDHAMQVDPAARHPSAEALERDLGGWLGREAPGTDASALARFARYLFAEEAREMGFDPDLPPGYARSLAPWRRPPAGGEAAEGVSTGAEALAETEVAPPPTSARRGLLLAVATLLVVVLAVGALLLLLQRGATARRPAARLGSGPSTGQVP